MKSDPEITVYHDRVTDNNQGQNPGQMTPQWGLVVAVGAIGAVAAAGAVVFMRKRKKKGEAKGENKPKKP